MAKRSKRALLYRVGAIAPFILVALLAVNDDFTPVSCLGNLLSAFVLAILVNWTLQLTWPLSGKPNWLAAILLMAVTCATALLLLAPAASSLGVSVTLAAICQLLLIGYAATALKPALSNLSKSKLRSRR
jgi:hypothetical protein